MSEEVTKNGVTTKALLLRLEDDFRDMRSDVKEVKHILQHEYVTKELFDLRVGRLEKVIYGMVGTVLIAVLVALLALVIRQ